MNTKSLSGLVDYLCGTLSREDMLFVSQKLCDCAMEQADEEPFQMRKYSVNGTSIVLQENAANK